MSQRLAKRLAAVSLVLMLTCGGMSPASTAMAAEPVFDWPEPVRIVVNAATAKDGSTMGSRFQVVTRAEPDSDNLIVTLEEFEILSFNSEPIDTLEERAALAPTQALMAFVPGFRISSQGELVSLVDYDLDAMLAELRAFITGQASPDAELDAVLDRVFERLRTPAMQTQIDARIGDIWNSWVGLWRTVSLTETAPQTVTTVIPVFGRELEQTMIIRNLGPDDACEGCVRLRAEAVLEGPELKDALLAMMRAQLPEAAGQEQKARFEAFADSLEGYRREVVMETVTDPATLRPASVMRETGVVLRARGAPPNERRDRSTWTFDWPVDEN